MKGIERYLPPAALVLADGTVFRGRGFGAFLSSPSLGELVFNTALSGYQEILTDPSYAGQILCFTCPHIGNVGCNAEDTESAKVHARGVVVRSLSERVSNYRALRSLHDYLSEEGVTGITDIDTRAVTLHLRRQGAQMGALMVGDSFSTDDLVDLARAQGSMEGKDYVREVSCATAYAWNELPYSLESNQSKKLSNESLLQRPHVVAVDCGIKRQILRLLTEVGFRVSVVPAWTTAEEIMRLRPDGVFLSNGPGDPATLQYVVEPARALLGKVPLFGICLGHQILGQALGGKTYKLKFGHRGGNHPVRDELTGKVEITVQNHGFAVAGALPQGVSVSHLNLNDRTIEGLMVPELHAFSVQYHPEASPGPTDSRYLFQRFYDLVTTRTALQR